MSVSNVHIGQNWLPENMISHEPTWLMTLRDPRDSKQTWENSEIFRLFRFEFHNRVSKNMELWLNKQARHNSGTFRNVENWTEQTKMKSSNISKVNIQICSKFEKISESEIPNPTAFWIFFPSKTKFFEGVFRIFDSYYRYRKSRLRTGPKICTGNWSKKVSGPKTWPSVINEFRLTGTVFNMYENAKMARFIGKTTWAILHSHAYPYKWVTWRDLSLSQSFKVILATPVFSKKSFSRALFKRKLIWCHRLIKFSQFEA